MSISSQEHIFIIYLSMIKRNLKTKVYYKHFYCFKRFIISHNAWFILIKSIWKMRCPPRVSRPKLIEHNHLNPLRWSFTSRLEFFSPFPPGTASQLISHLGVFSFARWSFAWNSSISVHLHMFKFCEMSLDSTMKQKYKLTKAINYCSFLIVQRVHKL